MEGGVQALARSWFGPECRTYAATCGNTVNQRAEQEAHAMTAAVFRTSNGKRVCHGRPHSVLPFLAKEELATTLQHMADA